MKEFIPVFKDFGRKLQGTIIFIPMCGAFRYFNSIPSMQYGVTSWKDFTYRVTSSGAWINVYRDGCSFRDNKTPWRMSLCPMVWCAPFGVSVLVSFRPVLLCFMNPQSPFWHWFRAQQPITFYSVGEMNYSRGDQMW